MTWLARLKKHTPPNTDPTEPTKPGFVGFVGIHTGHIQKTDGDTPAANDPEPDPDRWCWPRGEAMNGAEINADVKRVARFTEKSVTQIGSEVQADKMAMLGPRVGMVDHLQHHTVDAGNETTEPFVEPPGYEGTGWRLAGADGLSAAALAKFRAASLALDRQMDK